MPIYLFSFLNFLPQIIETAYKAFCTYFGLEWFIYFLFFKNTFPLLLFSFSFKTLSVFIPSSSIFSNIVEDTSLWPNVYIFCWIMHDYRLLYSIKVNLPVSGFLHNFSDCFVNILGVLSLMILWHYVHISIIALITLCCFLSRL